VQRARWRAAIERPIDVYRAAVDDAQNPDRYPNSRQVFENGRSGAPKGCYCELPAL